MSSETRGLFWAEFRSAHDCTRARMLQIRALTLLAPTAVFDRTEPAASGEFSAGSRQSSTFLGGHQRVSARRSTRLAQVAQPPLAEGAYDVGPNESASGAVSASDAPSHAVPNSGVAKPCPEEPDASNRHVRIRGGPGKATSRAYPSDLERVAKAERCASGKTPPRGGVKPVKWKG